MAGTPQDYTLCVLVYFVGCSLACTMCCGWVYCQLQDKLGWSWRVFCTLSGGLRISHRDASMGYILFDQHNWTLLRLRCAQGLKLVVDLGESKQDLF